MGASLGSLAMRDNLLFRSSLGLSRWIVSASLNRRFSGFAATGTVHVFDDMQPGRPFLRSLQLSLLKRLQGKVHCENATLLRGRRRRQRHARPERVESDPKEPSTLERRDIVNHVLAAAKACSMVDPAKVTEDANFEELELQKGDVVVLVLAVLKKYGLSLSYVEARSMTTCTELIDHIESQLVKIILPARKEGH